MAQRAAPKKRPDEAQPLRKAAPKKTVAAKKVPRRTPTAEAAIQKRASAQARARTVAAGSPVSHAPPRNRSRTTASRSGGIRPANSRPGSARPRPAAAGRSARKRGFGIGNGRPVWVLGAVGVMLALLILPYFQKWLVQRSELEATRAEVVEASQDVLDLEKQKERWKDDDYVRAQARARLTYVMPGEIGYVTSDPAPTPESTAPVPVQADVPAGNRSWFSSVWLSAEAAGAEGEAQATTVVP